MVLGPNLRDLKLQGEMCIEIIATTSEGSTVKCIWNFKNLESSFDIVFIHSQHRESTNC